ncbi:uncharacterized protein LOC131237005 [Magnolia sinica]|uniref:uncharacterized protein LOC131237005 n=1 Tax=Magnolia sinica TaxID=86752 RepID=UPI002659727A|nr:uncharacterized protein LOC131237005 [Magnolia sinica]XP_058090594.1 uncharacterized protein LOC131237005 [Magnolia sinica]
MGGILHLFDFNQASTSRKLLTHKRHAGGLEAPRNSLELPIETLQSYHTIHENIPYSYQVKQHSSKNKFYPSGIPMKKLIDEEVSKQTDSRRNVPSVVARLMGVDTLPSDVKPVVYAKEKKNENARNKQAENGSAHFSPLISKPAKQSKQDFLLPSNKQVPEKFNDRLKFTRPQHREHPQEEQLQKFKKEFEAWQASKVWEHSRSVELGNNPRKWKYNQTLAQESLNKEKMVRHADAKRNPADGKPIEPMDYTSPTTSKTSTEQLGGLRNHRYKSKEVMTLRNRSKSCDFEEFPKMNCDEKFGRSSIPTRIVILKPGPERTDDPEESWVGSSEIVEEEGSIEDFLEEVKEKLRLEIEGNIRKDTTVGGMRIETPSRERPTDPKEIARHIAKQVRESVTRDLGMNLLRSESTRSYRSEVQLNGPGSPEFIDKDTRKFLSERLRNILRDEGDVDIPMVISGSLKNPALDREGGRLRSMAYAAQTGKKTSYWGNMRDEPGTTKTRSFRHEKKNDHAFNTGEVSPRNLIRSLSAPVSGTSFGKLLLEEPHVLTGAHIRRKHEAAENVSVEVRKTRKDRFSFRGKVSSLRYSLTLRGRLFGKKIPLVEESGANESDFVKAFMTAPSVLMNLGAVQENSTEVPPSPASLCSSPHEEYAMQGEQRCPVSALDVPFVEDNPVPQIFREINSNLQELKKQLNDLQSDAPQEAAIEEDPLEVEVVGLECQAQVYIRDILVVSGLYDGSSTLAEPIDCCVFEEVEAAYKRRGKEGEGAAKGNDESKVGHKVLFDLLNEVISTILASPVSKSRFMRGVLGSTMAMPLGKKLLDDVWRMMHVYIYTLENRCQSLDDMAADDMARVPWLGTMHYEVDAIGRELEWMIVGELVDEVLREMCH